MGILNFVSIFGIKLNFEFVHFFNIIDIPSKWIISDFEIGHFFQTLEKHHFSNMKILLSLRGMIQIKPSPF